MAQNNQNQNKAQNQNKPQGQQTQETTDKAAEELKVKAEQETTDKAAEDAKVKLPVDSAKYAKYCNLKFVQLSETKLKDAQIAELATLEAELKECTGAIAKRTVRAAIKNEQVLIVAGIPVTTTIEVLVKSEGSEAYYFA